MLKHLSLFLAASFLWMSQAVLASNNDDDGEIVEQSTRHNSRASQNRNVRNDNEAIFSWYSIIEQPGTLIDLREVHLIEIMEWLGKDSLESLLGTSRYFRAFLMPVLGIYLDAPDALIKPLLIDRIARSSGDINLFDQDQRDGFNRLPTNELRRFINAGFYKGLLLSTEQHGQVYRSGHKKMIVEEGRQNGTLDLNHQGLSLVSLNFSGVDIIQTLNLSGNNLKALPDLSVLKNLWMLCLEGNQLTTIPGAEELKELRVLYLSDNRFKTIPLEFSNHKKLNALFIEGNPLEVPPVLSSARFDLSLGMDAKWFNDPRFIKSLGNKDASRMQFWSFTIDETGNKKQERVIRSTGA